jgi:hypothetical protein
MPEIKLIGDSESLPDMVVMADMIVQLIKEIQVGGRDKELAPKRTGKIILKLFFSGVTAQKRRKTVEISMRLMSSGDSAKNITLQKIQAYSNSIVRKFGDWQHTAGKKMYSYCDWDKGYQFQLLVPRESEAKRIVETLLDIQGHSPEWEYLNLCQNANESKRYPEIPSKVTIAGKQVRPPQQRPTAVVKFQRALIKFPHLPIAFPLCSPQGNLVKDLNFLETFDG